VAVALAERGFDVGITYHSDEAGARSWVRRPARTWTFIVGIAKSTL
jgi:hypothetical protein